MFAKLFKYDFKSIRRYALPLLLALLVVTVVGAINGAFFIGSIEDIPESDTDAEIMGNVVSMMFSTFTFIFTIIAIIAISVIAGILVMVDYYKTTVTDEAYLTFTLPVKTRDILLSKLLNSFVWYLIFGFACVVSMAIIIITMVLSAPSVPSDAPSSSIGLLDFFGINGFSIFLALIYGVVSIINACLLYFMAITLSSMISKKHKLLSAVGCVIGVNFAYGIVNNIISVISLLITESAGAISDSNTFMVNLSMIISIVTTAGFSVLFYFLTKNMLEKKLNLA